MKFVVLMAVIVFAAARPDDNLSELNIRELVENDKLLNAYLACFNEEGKCTPEANSIKKLTPQAVETSCGDCHPEDRKKIAIFLNAAQKKNPEALKKVIAKYDPEGKRQAELDEFVKTYS